MAKAPKILSKAEIKAKTNDLKAARKVVLDTFAPYASPRRLWTPPPRRPRRQLLPVTRVWPRSTASWLRWPPLLKPPRSKRPGSFRSPATAGFPLPLIEQL